MGSNSSAWMIFTGVSLLGELRREFRFLHKTIRCLIRITHIGSRIGGLKIHFDWIHRCTCMVETTSPTNVSITNISTSSLKDFYNENNHAPIPCIAVKLGITSLDPKSKVPKLVTTIQDSSMKSVLLAIDQIASTIVACGEEYRAKNDDSAFVPVLLNDVNVKSTMFMTTAKTEVRVLEVARADSIPDVPPPQETLELGLLQL
ncbi:hypothetical protein CLOP_g8679 [Closterium sp. NIES-67]|nr:hypothetical protein CLOP_g8679 [Closterium sp. NIES-67]